MAVEQTVLPVTELDAIPHSAIPFVMDTNNFLGFIQASGRDPGRVTPSSIKYNGALFEQSVFDCRDGTKPEQLTLETFQGLMSLLRWVGNGHESRFLRKIDPAKKLEYLVTMARRDLLTNNAGQIMSYGLSFVQLHEGRLDDAFATITSSPLDPFVSEMSARSEQWGFSDAYDLVKFTAAFDALEKTYFYGQLEPRVRYSMPVNYCDQHKVRLEEFNKLEARKAIFTYFYLNKLFPQQDSQRQTALHRLGLPQFIRPIAIEETRCHDRIHGKDIGAFISFLNSPYIRYGFNTQLFARDAKPLED
jgi:hypothetical protein